MEGIIVQENLTIDKVHRVFDGEYVPGKFPGWAHGRTSDAFVYFLYGEADYIFENYTITVHPQNFFYLSSGSIYQIQIRKPSKYICIDFDFKDRAGKEEGIVFPFGSATIKNKFIRLFNIWNMNSPWSKAKVFSGVYDLYAEAIKTFYKDYAKIHPVFTEITAFIFEHYCKPNFSVEKISEAFDISEAHLRRIFKTATDITPLKYMNYLRLEKAKNMLRYSNCSVYEVALSVGITDPYYFSRMFKKELGVSPTEYRKENLV